MGASMARNLARGGHLLIVHHVRPAAEAVPTGVEVLDAPVSGGPDGAVSGRLAVWIGGEGATVGD